MSGGHHAARLRRIAFFALVLATALGSVGLLAGAVQTGGITPLEVLLLGLYGALSTWIATAFWTGFFGFVVLATGWDAFRISDRRVATPGPEARTAVVMPVYNEDPERVYAGLRAMWRDLAGRPGSTAFDFFILSDTRSADLWVEEEVRWQRMVHELGAGGRVFYRNRPKNTSRKSGNIADFIQRFGAAYRYAVVLDADSMMSGETLLDMVAIMEANPEVAIVQVPPVPVNRTSLFARTLQFAGSLYGRMYAAGLAFWQMGEGNFWGHNAILRIAPFAAHCGLPRLPGEEPFGGEILSHDFVEAALLRRAGWRTWMAYDLGGSFEEIPPTLIDYAKRDRRWCQGNLQHMRMVLARGWHALSRVHLAMGVMSYVASPLWLLFIVLTAVEAYVQSKTVPVYFFGETLFPVWPENYAFELTTVLWATLAMLLLPKLLALALLAADGEARRLHGGLLGAAASVLLETAFSILLAPVMMLFQSKFVFSILLRRAIGWPAQQRGDHHTGFAEALGAHGGQLLIAMAAGLATWHFVPAFFWWFTPVLAGLLLAIPFSMLTSRVPLGLAARRWRLFISPHEVERPGVLALLDEELRLAAGGPPTPAGGWFVAAIRDPAVHALHASFTVEQALDRRARHHLEGLELLFQDEGPGALGEAERRAILAHRETLHDLHLLVWSEAREAA